MRGARLGLGGGCDAPGIIPAYAGSTFEQGKKDKAPWDHPRVCGEHTNYNSYTATVQGSSPRMRGAQVLLAERTVDRRIIPAYAGSTGSSSSGTSIRRDHPRVCGEHTKKSLQSQQYDRQDL